MISSKIQVLYIFLLFHFQDGSGVAVTPDVQHPAEEKGFIPLFLSVSIFVKVLTPLIPSPHSIVRLLLLAHWPEICHIPSLQ